MGRKFIYLPDFIIIGANKAGTSSVAHYLNQNPTIKISDEKEPMFFSSTPEMISAKREDANLENSYFAITLDEYSKMFENCTDEVKFFGEASTAYLANPYRSAALIKKLVPNVKIIVILREPVSRAISAYKMCCGFGIEDRSFNDIVKTSENQKTILKTGQGVKEYFQNGLYSQLLDPYISYFDQSQLLFLNYTELEKKPKSFMEKISGFIGAEYFHVNYNKKVNTESEYIKNNSPKIFLKKVLNVIGADYLPENLGKKLMKISKIENNEIEIDDNDIDKLKLLYEDDIIKLQTIVDFDISSWIPK